MRLQKFHNWTVGGASDVWRLLRSFLKKENLYRYNNGYLFTQLFSAVVVAERVRALETELLFSWHRFESLAITSNFQKDVCTHMI